jgi:hypothetical protein
LKYTQFEDKIYEVKTNIQYTLGTASRIRIECNKLAASCTSTINNIKAMRTLLARPSLMAIGVKIANVKTCTIMAIRKFKVFNKGRYSRTRQLYRTGVYWCLFLNIILVVGLYFWFYRFMFNFGYIWWVFCLFAGSFFFGRSLNYQFANLVSAPIAIINFATDSVVQMIFFIKNTIRKISHNNFKN